MKPALERTSMIHRLSALARSLRAPAIATLGVLLSCCASAAEPPTAHVAIFVSTEAGAANDLRPVYDWAIDSVNRSGGAGGKKLEAQYYRVGDDVLAKVSAQEALATQVLADPDLVAVTGVLSFPLASAFVAAKVPYFASESTDPNVFRAFSRTGDLWLTLESDSTMLWLLLEGIRAQATAGAAGAVPTVALLSGTDTYGSSFFDWFGFHATELGLRPFTPEHYDQSHGPGCDPAVTKLLAQGSPDYLVASVSGELAFAHAACIVRTMRSRSPATRLVFSDSVRDPALLAALGHEADGLSGVTQAPDPASGFAAAFTARTARPLPSKGASAYDAIALLSYGLEQSGGSGGAALQAGLRVVVDGRGPVTDWTASGMGAAKGLIRAGQHPDVTGVSGPLAFDAELYTEPTGTFYERWSVEDGAFVSSSFVTTETQRGDPGGAHRAMARGLKGGRAPALPAGHGSVDLPTLDQSWALLMATSGSWKNYRHQADVLAQYQALKSNGFDDDHIVLMLFDDIADAKENRIQGQIFNSEFGVDLRADVVVDYKGKLLTPLQVMTVLEGGSGPGLPAVIRSKSTDNVYVFSVGHGDAAGPYIGLGEDAVADDDASSFLTPELLGSTVARMSKNHQFRRMFIAVDACHAGTLGPALEAQEIPDVILFAAANRSENSLAANYAPKVGSWVADELSFGLATRAGKSPDVSIAALYEGLFAEVTGSHVQVYNSARFGDHGTIQLREFVVPRDR